jgi:hypothetical protein
VLEKVAASMHDAASEVPAELCGLRDKAEMALTGLRKQRQAKASSKHEAKLPDALRNFVPLAKEPEVIEVVEAVEAANERTFSLLQATRRRSGCTSSSSMWRGAQARATP